MLDFPINPLADDGTSVQSLLRGGYRLVPVFRPVGLSASWTPLASSGYNAAMTAIPGDLSILENGLYDFGIQVTCNGQSFISDVTKGSIDRSLPQVHKTFPMNGGSVDSSQGIQVVFDEPLDCQKSLAAYSIANQAQVDVDVLCVGSTVDILLSPSQVCENQCFILKPQ